MRRGVYSTSLRWDASLYLYERIFPSVRPSVRHELNHGKTIKNSNQPNRQIRLICFLRKNYLSLALIINPSLLSFFPSLLPYCIRQISFSLLFRSSIHPSVPPLFSTSSCRSIFLSSCLFLHLFHCIFICGLLFHFNCPFICLFFSPFVNSINVLCHTFQRHLLKLLK